MYKSKMAAAARWRTWRLAAILFCVFIPVVYGYEEMYTISQLSPKSISYEHLPEDTVLQTSKTDSLPFSIEPSSLHQPEILDINDEEEDTHHIVARSADPIVRESRSINIDEVPHTNNEIDNELELHNKRKYYDIHPTKTIDYLHSKDDVILSSEGFGDRLEFRFPGEGVRVPYGRALPAGPKIRPTAVQPIFATANPRNEGRQNTEIQNIITGIVKLLNGNVNVQANTQLLRPGRPLASRINNRGPPRISDVPPLHDFEKPLPPPHGLMPTKTPPPYPFERPPVHVNLPEQIVPPLPRPGLHRPMPPWQRPRPRPPTRRPNPGLPMYKPNVPIIPDYNEESSEVTANENETVHSENTLNHEDVSTPEVTTIGVDKVTKEAEPETTSTSTTTEQTTQSTTTTEKTTEKPTEKTTTSTEKPKTEKTKLDKKKDAEKKNKLEEKIQKVTEKIIEDKTTNKPTIKPDTNEVTTQKEVKLEEVVKELTTENIELVKPPQFNKTEDKVLNVTKNDSVVEIQSSIVESKTSDILTPTPTEGLITHAPTLVESTVAIESTSINSQPLPTSQGIPYHPYRPRPGIVLDDPEFKRGNSRRRTEVAVVTAPPQGYGEIFDVTVSAIQGPGGKGGSVHIETVNPLSPEDDIIVSASGQQGFVSIDGKRTYLNLFDTSTVAPTRVHTATHSVAPLPAPPLAPQGVGQGVAIPADDDQPVRRPQVQGTTLHRPQGYRRPQPTVRIDTCIVGDDSTCDKAQNEKCRTEAGISSCQCRPGFARRIHRDPCRRVVSLILNLRVDRLYDRKVAWDAKLSDKDSEPYQQLSYEAVRAIDSAFSMTPFSDDFVSGSVNTIHKGDENNHGVFVNYTILMQETGETLRQSIATDIQKHILGVIRRRSNNVGASALWVDSVAGSVLPLNDVDECASPDLNDCHQLATCTNTWGGFKCACPSTTLDAGSASFQGRECRACPASTCSDRGLCHYVNNQPHCSCSSGYYGSKCEVDGEVVGVAVGACLAAALVIALTLAGLMAWSRKWSREQKAAGMGSPVFNYMAANTIKTPPVGQPPYQVTLEERMRWAQIAEAMVQANHYASEVQTMATRPSSAMFGGYPTLPPVPLPRMGMHGGHHNGTLNTVTSRNNTASHHNLYGYTNHMATESTSSEASSHAPDRTDLLVPRPKSRSRSMHNQTGIYYDVDYENAPEPIYGSKGIPLSTYTVSRGPPFYR